MRNRVDKLGVASPEIRKQGTDQIVIQLAGVHNPEQAAAIIGKTAQLELYDLEPALVPPSVTASGASRSRRRTSTSCSRASRPPRRTARRAGYVLFKPVKVKTTTGTGKNKKTKTTVVWVKAAGPIATLHRDPSTGNAGLLDASHGKIPKGDKVLPVPARHRRDHLLVAERRRLPGRQRGRAAAGQDRLLPLQARRLPERPRTGRTRT